MSNKGKAGEDAAALYLEKRGMKVLEKNFRTRMGEIDIIVLDKETVAFVEVKAWSSYGMDALEHAINAKKRHKIIETSKYFLSLHREYRYMAIRFDVIFVSSEGIAHLASAFVEHV